MERRKNKSPELTLCEVVLSLIVSRKDEGPFCDSCHIYDTSLRAYLPGAIQIQPVR